MYVRTVRCQFPTDNPHHGLCWANQENVLNGPGKHWIQTNLVGKTGSVRRRMVFWKHPNAAKAELHIILGGPPAGQYSIHLHLYMFTHIYTCMCACM